MSGSTTPAAPREPILTQQGIIAIVLLLIGAATVAGVFIKGDPAAITTIAGLVIGAAIGSVSSFYFGSSKGSQTKDAAMLPKEGPKT